MQGKKFIILISVAAAIIVIAFGLLFYFSVRTPAPGESASPLRELIPFGSRIIPSAEVKVGERETKGEEQGAAVAGTPSRTALKQVSNLPVAGFAPIVRERFDEGRAEVNFLFEQDLKEGDRGEQVKYLQVFLNSAADILDPNEPAVGPIAKTGTNSPGKENGVFDKATKSAVIRFQNKYVDQILAPQDLKEGDGLFNEITRKEANRLLTNATQGLLAKIVGLTQGFEEVAAVRYVDRETGNIYEADQDNLRERRISTTTIPKVEEAIFFNRGRNIALRYLRDDNFTIETFLGSIKEEIPGGDFTPELTGSFLPQNITQLSAANITDRFFYLLEFEDGVIGINASTKENNQSQIFESKFNEWLIEWPNQRLITFTTKASSEFSGSLFTLDPEGKSFNKVLSGISGLTTLGSPNGKLFLYAGADLNLKVYNIDQKTITELGLRGLPEKCVFASDNVNLYCAIPKDIPAGDYPDSWYQGLLSFSDAFWRINLDTNAFKQLADPGESDGLIDGIKLQLDPKDNFLYFLNKRDSKLWSLTIN